MNKSKKCIGLQIEIISFGNHYLKSSILNPSKKHYYGDIENHSVNMRILFIKHEIEQGLEKCIKEKIDYKGSVHIKFFSSIN